LTALLPIRAGSQRVIRKNVKEFANYKFGLTELKIRQLLKVNLFSEILIDTDLPEIETILDVLASDGLKLTNIRVEKRDASLAGSDATTDDLIVYLADKVKTDIVLWTHTTQPFITPEIYKESIDKFQFALQESFDSLMTVSPLKTFIWNDKGEVNYSRKIEKWPRTQTLPSWYTINSGIFIVDSMHMKNYGDRIGLKPFLFEIDKLIGWDIDDMDDFLIAESIAKTFMKDKLFL
ncbi:MAG: hypothetical protein KDD56_10620, partial [Bdellovibrionales bacterium]|nr:hypothetical protein [Bdellovibrionales bacterium]